MTRIRGVHVSQHQLRGGAGEIVFELGGNQRTPAGLRVQFIKLRLRSCAEHVAHSDRPDATRYARQRDVLGVEAAIEKERETRAELVHRNAARGEHFHVSKSVRQRVSSLLYRRG